MESNFGDLFSSVFAFSLKNQLPKGWKKLLTSFQNSNVYFLPDCGLTDETIDFSNIDMVLMERLAIYSPLDECNKLFHSQDYQETDKHIWFLFRCHERATHLATQCSDSELEALNRCKTICITYSESLISEPEAFNFENAPESLFQMISSEYAKSNLAHFIGQLLKGPEHSFQKKKMFMDIVATCMKFLSDADVKVSDNIYMDSVHLLGVYVDVPELCEYLLNSEFWIPHPRVKLTGAVLEKTTLLGLILRATSMRKMGEPSLFSSVMDHAEASGTVSFLRTFIKNICDGLVEIFKKIFRNSKMRNRLYAWLIMAVRVNRDHAKLGARYYEEVKESLSSSGFFLNLTIIILRLLHPVIQVWGSKFDKINFKLLQRSCVVQYNTLQFEVLDFSGETKLLPTDTNDSLEICDIHDFNFITIMYFYCPWLISVALIPLWEEYRKVMMILHENRPENPFASVDEPESQQFQTLLRWQLAFKTHLCLPDLVEILSDALGAYSSHLLHLIGCNLFNGFNINYTPSSSSSKHEVLHFIPEFFVEIIPPCTLALVDFAKESILSNSDNLQSIICMLCVFMGTADLIRNPHLRAKLVECLGLLCNYEKQSDSYNRGPYSLNVYHCIKSFSFLPKLLVLNLMKLFIDIEFTGESNAFYQKFSYRRHMYMLLEYLWEVEEINDIFKQFSSEAVASDLKDNIPIFLRFINLLVNDASYLLEEALLLLPKIQLLEREMDDVATWRSLPEEVQKQKQEQYEQNRKQATSYNILSLQTVEILQLITNDIKKIFVWSVLEDRIACMLNFFLCSLVGSKKKELKVKRMSELNFEPKKLLIAICHIYSNLSDEERFPHAIIRDARSYDITLFDDARNLLDQFCCPSGVMMSLMKLKRRILKILDEPKNESMDDCSDIPDEFLDPISFALMEDPVIMPSSRKSIDRSTITQYLLSSNEDPFSRDELKIDMLIPNTALKERIDDWKASKKKPKQS